MRLWSIHPAYLDTKGLVACWRESLLAQKVLFGETKGYKNHPQLERFRNADSHDMLLVGMYLLGIYRESERRGMNFDYDKIRKPLPTQPLPVTTDQLHYEIKHLVGKLQKRGHDFWSRQMQAAWSDPIPHPLFYSIPGEIEPWEKVA